MTEQEILESGIRVLTIEANAVTDLIKKLDQSFISAVRLCLACQGHVVVIGMGKSGLIGRKITATFASTGTPAFFLHPSEGIHGDLGMVSKSDLIVLISNSGETEEILRILPSLKRLNLPLIALTGGLQSRIAKASDVVLDVSVVEEACSLGLAPTASTTAALAMGDALAVALLEKRGFKEEDFASFHPGGKLGRTLLLTVSDLMHSADDIPAVHSDTLMTEVVLEMTAKKFGMTTVVDEDNRLLGIITDGDLRRLFETLNESKGSIFSMQAHQVMSRHPKTIEKSTLAAEAVRQMELAAITTLVVTHQEETVEGVVHLHDLLKQGVA